MPNREWLTTDFYADLGVARTASLEEITERYRAQAWDLHPDRRPGDELAEAQFKRIARAYAVLGNAEQRAAYDATRDAVFDRGFAPTPGSTRPVQAHVRPKRMFNLNPRVGYVIGTLLLVLGLGAAGWIISITRHDAQLRRAGIPVFAVVNQISPAATVTFTTTDGIEETVPAPLLRDRRNGGYVLGEAVAIRYLRSNPQEIVVDESQTARNVTMWIIAIKLVACGLILVGLSVRQARLRARDLGTFVGQPVPA